MSETFRQLEKELKYYAMVARICVDCNGYFVTCVPLGEVGRSPEKRCEFCLWISQRQEIDYPVSDEWWF